MIKLPAKIHSSFKSHLLGAVLVVFFPAWANAAATNTTFKVGQTLNINGAKLTLIKAIDTRCLPRAHCIMAGDVQAKLLVARGSKTRLYTVFLPGKVVLTLAGEVTLASATARNTEIQKLTFKFTY